MTSQSAHSGTPTPTPTISVIVPIYNVAPYLEECLESIAAQTYEDFEAILVDDGSTDTSGNIAREFACRDHRFTVLSQSNKGLSAARNAGLDNARGQYVAFVDSDDSCDKALLEQLFSAIEQTGAPMACCGYREYVDSIDGINFITVSPKNLLITTINEVQFWNLRYSSPSELGTHAWGKLYRREVFKNMRYREGMVYEDVEISLRLLTRTASIAIVPETLYNYRVRPGSIVRTLSPQNCLDGFDAYCVEPGTGFHAGLVHRSAKGWYGSMRCGLGFSRRFIKAA